MATRSLSRRCALLALVALGGALLCASLVAAQHGQPVVVPVPVVAAAGTGPVASTGAAAGTGVAAASTGSAAGQVAPHAPVEETEDEKQEEEAEEVAEHPFLEVFGLLNGSWFKFAVIVVAASRLALVFPRIGLPLITGYMIIGCLCGPYVLGLVTRPQIPDLGYVTQTALAFIAYSAGSELYLPELRDLIRTIALITGFNAIFSYIICTLFIYAIAAGGLIPWMDEYMGSCAFTISLVAGSIMVARSPASAIAVVRELKAKGPATSIMLGVTVVGDVVVLVLFTLSNSFALAMCGGGGFEGGAFLVTLLTLCVAVLVGYGLGFLLIFLLWIPRIPAKFTIIPLGFIIFVLCDWLVVWTEEHWGVGLNFDALLICITAGYVVTNQSHNRVAFLKMLGSAGSYIFIPFFTLVGVQLNLAILVQSIAFGFLVFMCRALCIALGTFVGSRIAGLDRDKQLKLWMTMLAQAGVSLGLAAEVANKFPKWGSKFQTTIISVVLINQFAGPVLCKKALVLFGEAGKMSEDEEEHGEHGAPKAKKRAILFGVDATSLSVAAKLLAAGWRVTMLDQHKANLILAKALGVPKKDTNSTIDGPASASVSASRGSRSLGDVSIEMEPSESTLLSPEVPASDSSAPAFDEHGHPIAAKEPSLDLLLAPRDAHATPSQSFGGVLLGAGIDLSKVECCILALHNDQAQYELGVWLVRAQRAPRVLVRVHNPAWVDNYRQQSLLPVAPLGSTAGVLTAAAKSKGNLVLTSATLNLSDALNSLIDPIADLNHSTLPLSGEQRLEWEDAHPAPTEESFSEVSRHLLAAGMSAEDVRRLHKTAAADVHADRFDALVDRMDVGKEFIPVSAEQQRKVKESFLGVSSQLQRDSDKRAARREGIEEEAAAEERALAVAMGGEAASSSASSGTFH